MKNSLFKNCLIFVVILLFIGTYINSAIGQDAIENKKLLLKEQSNSFEEWLFDLKIRTLLMIGRFPSLSGCIIKQIQARNPQLLSCGMNRMEIKCKTPTGVFFPLRGKPRHLCRGRGDKIC